MAASRTGVSTLRNLCRLLTRLVQRYPGVLINPAVPEELSAAIAAVVAVCAVSDFDNPGAGEITGAGVVP